MAGELGLNPREGLKALGIDTSTFLHRYAPVAQRTELMTLTHQAAGSNPARSTQVYYERRL